MVLVAPGYLGRIRNGPFLIFIGRRSVCPTIRMASIAENLERVREQIAQAAAKAGRPVNEIELVAITKTHPAEQGARGSRGRAYTFWRKPGPGSPGENSRAAVKLALAFRRTSPEKQNPASAAIVRTFSRSRFACTGAGNETASQPSRGMHPRVLLEVNVAGEGTKFGFKAETLHAEIGSLLELPRLSIEGLMCIPPLAEEAEGSRKFFVQLRELRNSLEKEFDVKFPHLSMGMTQDFSIAVEEGATLVRVGTAIFGERPKRRKD